MASNKACYYPLMYIIYFSALLFDWYLKCCSISNTWRVNVGCWQQLLKILWMLIMTYNKKCSIHYVAELDPSFCLTAQIPGQIFYQFPRNILERTQHFPCKSHWKSKMTFVTLFAVFFGDWLQVGESDCQYCLDRKQCLWRNSEIKMITRVNLIFFFHCTFYNAIDLWDVVYEPLSV